MKKREIDAKASSSLPKGVKENDLKFFLTNGFKVDIIYLYSETNRIKSDWVKEKINDLALTHPDSFGIESGSE